MNKDEFVSQVPVQVREWLKSNGIKICSADACTSVVQVKNHGLCDKHYRRLKKGQPVNEPSVYDKTTEDRFWEQVDCREDADDCWNWTGGVLECGGYGRFTAGVYSKIKETRAHRFSYSMHYKVKIGDLCVLHKCDNRLCVNPDHLFLGDRADNSKDKVAKGRQCRGESRPLSKLSEDAVRKIRRSDESTSVLAARFNVSPAAVSMARHNKTWKHVL